MQVGWKRHFASGQMPLPGHPSIWSSAKIGTFDGFRERLKKKFPKGDHTMDKATALFKEIGLDEMANNEGEAATFLVASDEAMGKLSPETIENVKRPDSVDREIFLAAHVIPQTINHSELSQVSSATFDTLHDDVKFTVFGERDLPPEFPKDEAFYMFHDSQENVLSSGRIITYAPPEEDGAHSMYLLDSTAGF